MKMCIRDRQNTLQYNAGIETSVWRNIIVVNFDAYLKRTQNLLLNVDVAPSTGFSSYKENMGSIDNKGFEAVSYTHLDVYKRQSWCLPVSGTVAHRKKSRTIPTMNVRRKIVLFIS